MTGKEILKQLKQAGFVLLRINGSHHIVQKGDIEIAVPVHGSKDIPIGTAHAILKRAGIKR